MQGKKTFTPQLFVSVNLLELVPADNFYRKLLTELDLHFIYKATQNPHYAKKMVRVRSKTVEPVIGTLVNFTNMKRVNTRGIKNANKHVLMASLTYNLKKYLRFVVKKPTILTQVASLKVRKSKAFVKSTICNLKNLFLSHQEFTILNFS